MQVIGKSSPSFPKDTTDHTPDSTSARPEQGRQGWLDDERVGVTPIPNKESSTSTPLRSTFPPTTTVTVSPVSSEEQSELSASQVSPSTPSSPGRQEDERPSRTPFFRKTDLAYAIGQFQNRPYLASERHPDHLPRFRESVKALHTAVQNPQVPKEHRQALSRSTEHLINKIDAVVEDRSMSYRSAAMLMFGMANVGLAILPIVTSAKNQDNQYLSLLVAGYAKTMLMLVGLALSKTADVSSHMQHIKERHVPYLPPNIPYALSAFNPGVKAFEDKHPVAFGAAAVAFTASVFAITSAPQLITKPLDSAYQAIKNYINSTQPGQIPRETLSEELTTEINTLLDIVKSQHGAFSERREIFESIGGRVGDSLNLQLSEIDHAMASLNAAVDKLVGTETDNPEELQNKDFAQKMAFLVIAAAVCIGSAATYYDEPTGLVDLGMDAGLVVYEMAKTALAPGENAQQAASKFSSYSGLSPLLLPYGIINKIPATHFTDNTIGLVLGTLVLTACNLTLPRPGGEAIADGIVKLMDSMKNRGSGRSPDIEQGASELRDSGRFTEISADEPRETEMASLSSRDTSTSNHDRPSE